MADRLRDQRVEMVEFPQTPENLTKAASFLYTAIKDQRLIAYEDADFESQIQHAVGVETARGWRLAKEKTSYKIDLIAALSFACVGAQELPQNPLALLPPDALRALIGGRGVKGWN